MVTDLTNFDACINTAKVSIGKSIDRKCPTRNSYQLLVNLIHFAAKVISRRGNARIISPMGTENRCLRY